MIVKILALIDLHTLFVLMFHDYLPLMYIVAGATFPFTKGLIFYLSSKDLFSFIDMLVGLIMLFLLVGSIWGFLWWIIFIYLVYKIILSFAAF